MRKRNNILYAILLLTFLSCSCSTGTVKDIGTGQEIAVLSVKDIGPVSANKTIVGRDGGFSALYGDKSVWLFGDTVLSAPNRYNVNWNHNSWSYTTDLSADDGISGFTERADTADAVGEFFPQTVEERSFNKTHFEDRTVEPLGARLAVWPGPIVADPARKRMIVFYHKIYAEPGGFNFYPIGHSVAIWENFRDTVTRPEYNLDPVYPTLMFFAGREPAFGAAAVVKDKYIYVYSSDSDTGSGGIIKKCRVARILLEKVTDRGAWQFFYGNGVWGPDSTKALVIFYGNDMMSIHYNLAMKRYIAVYSAPVSRNVCMRSARSPEGPWSRQQVLFTVKMPGKNPGWIYDALAHPEYSIKNEKNLYISYSRNRDGLFKSEMRLVRVGIALINK